MNILFLSLYFEPDLSAGSFRNSNLFKEIMHRMGKDDYIHVITTMPNRYHSYKVDVSAEEVGDNYKISRIQLPNHTNGMWDQSKAYTVFYREAFRLVKKERFQLVYASSSRLFTALLGRQLANKFKAILYLDVRDIFVDTIADLFAGKPLIQRPLTMFLKLIERYTFKNANHINLISEGFSSYFAEYSKPNKTFFTNGIDNIFISAGKEATESVTKPYLITYAGNIGSGQGLEKIIPEAAKRLGNDYHFRIIGSGGTLNLLEERIKDMQLNNVEILKPVARNELIHYYKESTFLFFHLNNFDAFKKVLPSKMFEYGAFDKPIIAGVGGYAKEFVQRYIPNHILFEPTDVDSFVRQIRDFKIEFKERVEFKERFQRSTIDREMADSILSYL